MNKQYLQNFTEEQLHHYISTLKQRVNDMRQFTVELERENADLEKEYNAKVTEKKLLNIKIIEKTKGWNRWVNAGKEAVNSMIHIVKKPEKNAYEPEQKQVQTKINQQQEIDKIMNYNIIQGELKDVENKGKIITIGNFDFDDLYHLGKDKLTGILDRSGNKIRDITGYIKQRYTESKSEVQPEQIDQRIQHIQLKKEPNRVYKIFEKRTSQEQPNGQINKTQKQEQQQQQHLGKEHRFDVQNTKNFD